MFLNRKTKREKEIFLLYCQALSPNLFIAKCHPVRLNSISKAPKAPRLGGIRKSRRRRGHIVRLQEERSPAPHHSTSAIKPHSCSADPCHGVLSPQRHLCSQLPTLKHRWHISVGTLPSKNNKIKGTTQAKDRENKVFLSPGDKIMKD